MKQLRIVITGGGSGGHVTPALAVADELKSHGAQIYFIGSKNETEQHLVSVAGYEFLAVATGKFRRYLSLTNIVDLFKVLVGLVQSYVILGRIKPQAVFAKGGYVSVPVAYAAWLRNIPVITHESDVVMGLANRLIAKKASRVCTGFPVDAYKKLELNNLVYTGNPVRSMFLEKQESKSTTYKRLKFVSGKPTLLVMGGSQGAMAINAMLFEKISEYLKTFQIIHLTGEYDFVKAKDLQKKLDAKPYQPYSFVTSELTSLLNIADIVVARASANTFTELAYLQKPTIIIPLPSAASDHQRANAKYIEAAGGALVLEQNKLTADLLYEKVVQLSEDAKTQSSLSKAIHSFYIPSATADIAKHILEEARQSTL
jgi:UDP-N-acetylglucosamine--N-acetylmuramyl-(pentapeptide) pyrophosphoryl-undecaprenol N-acetylglucosamine transferase